MPNNWRNCRSLVKFHPSLSWLARQSRPGRTECFAGVDVPATIGKPSIRSKDRARSRQGDGSCRVSGRAGGPVQGAAASAFPLSAAERHRCRRLLAGLDNRFHPSRFHRGIPSSLWPAVCGPWLWGAVLRHIGATIGPRHGLRRVSSGNCMPPKCPGVLS